MEAEFNPHFQDFVIGIVFFGVVEGWQGDVGGVVCTTLVVYSCTISQMAKKTNFPKPKMVYKHTNDLIKWYNVKYTLLDGVYNDITTFEIKIVLVNLFLLSLSGK